jgi:hypothetical protein
MLIDEDRLTQVVSRLCVNGAVEELGVGAANAVARLWPDLRNLYQFVEPLMLTSPIAVAVAVGVEREMPLLRESNPRNYATLSSAATDIGQGGWLLELLASGTVRRWLLADVDSTQLARFAVLYTYNAGTETLRAGQRTCEIPNLSPQASPSAFARPTFLNLEDALDKYRQHVARTAQCPHLKKTLFDTRRLYWKARPEEEMRRSLFQYLYNVLSGDAEIRPEQVMDESHPVDIKVTWNFVNRLAIIEIKWIGDSRNEDASPATSYRDARAKSGAKQLAEYLDANRALTPTYHTKGYLVVFDARRAGLGPGIDKVSRNDGFFYENKEIQYDPEHHKERPDFAEPMRLFVEPIV